MMTEIPAAIPAPKSRVSRAALILAVLGVIDLATGAGLWFKAGTGSVELIRVTRTGMLPESFVGTPDYYLSIGIVKGEPIVTDSYSNTPIGNGLDFKLKPPLEMEQFTHVELMDEDVASDDTLDRVDIRERVCSGQEYQFELMGPQAPMRTAAYAMLSSGAALLLFAAIALVRSFAL